MMHSRDSERLIFAVHALTDRWISGDVAATLIDDSPDRGELLVKGIIDLDWLKANILANAQFASLAAAALSGVTGEDESVPIPGPSEPGLQREEAMRLIAPFCDDPTGASPLAVLRRLAAKQEGR